MAIEINAELAEEFYECRIVYEEDGVECEEVGSYGSIGEILDDAFRIANRIGDYDVYSTNAEVTKVMNRESL